MRKEVFADAVTMSQFVLCPAGEGSPLYETLAAGRVPVILADGWAPPPGPRWSDFALIWPERDVPSLPLQARGHGGAGPGYGGGRPRGL